MDCCGSGTNRTRKTKGATSNPDGGGGWPVRLALVFIAGMSIGYFLPPLKPSAPLEDGENHLEMIKNKSIAGQREDWIALADNIRGKMAMEGKYNCCLKNPCLYCIQKTPGHGEGAECTCFNDILNGKHPCGECIGEILEGNGHDELKPYFAEAIAEKVGAKHKSHLQEIIDDLYAETGKEDSH